MMQILVLTRVLEVLMLSELVAGSVARVCFETCYGWQVGECSRRDRCHRAAGAVKRNERSV